jgi:hypothetical protein
MNYFDSDMSNSTNTVVYLNDLELYNVLGILGERLPSLNPIQAEHVRPTFLFGIDELFRF